MTVLYGSSVASTVLTTASAMAITTGGAEVSVLPTHTGSGLAWLEMPSRAITVAEVASLPAPTGNGLVYQPGAGSFAAGSWTAKISVSCTFAGGTMTLRAYRYSSGVYTAIGSVAVASSATAKTIYTFTFTGLSTTFGASDLLYFDLWWNDSSGAGDGQTLYLSNSATAGVANDFQVTTSTWTPAASGNTIVGRARAKYLEALAQTGASRARFAESIGSFGRSHSKFTLSIGSKQTARSKFLVSIAQKGISRSQFVISNAIKGLSRSNYLVSKASRGLARSKFTEAIAQRSPARSKFLISVAMRGLAESTFKIFAAGHAITAYMRSRYTVSIRQAQAQRSKFLIRFSQTGIARSLFKVAARASAQARSRFLVRFGITGRARSRYLLSIRQTVLARSRFITRLALAVRARSKFLIQGILVTYPIKSITHAVSQVLSAAWNVLSALGLTSSHASALILTRQELAMPAPNSTILPTITVTDISGALVSNASAVSLVVYFPDGTSSNYSLTSGITNLGAGQYQAKYNTKQAGEIREVWSIVGADGTTLASAQFLVGVEY